MPNPERNLPEQSFLEMTPNPERLSDEQLGSLISAVGNSEAKALTLIAMADREIYKRNELDTRMLSVQGAIKGWVMGKGLPYQYCRLSFAPIGLVTTELTDESNNIYGYVITNYGLNEGLTLSGLVTPFSERHEGVALHQVLGRTNSRSEIVETEDEAGEYRKRAPLTRLKIFRELITHPHLPIRVTDLALTIGENLDITKTHLNQLRRFGIITYTSFEEEGGYTVYTPSEDRPSDDPIPFHKYRALTDFTYNYVLKHAAVGVTSDVVINAYIAATPGAENLSRRYIQNNISGALLSLSRQGFLEKRGYTKEERSQVFLTPEQMEFLKEFVSIIDRFQNRDPEIWDLGRRQVLELISNPVRISALLKKARDLSQQANQLESAELASYIYTILSDYPDSDVSEIRELLEEEYEIGLSKKSIAMCARELARDQSIVRVKDGRSYRYRLK